MHTTAPESQCGHILVVDDDPDGLKFVVQLLRAYDFAVSTAVSGRQGINLIQRQQPDLVLLELQMPDTHGFEILESLKSTPLTGAIPVILLTAYDGIKSKIRGFELGAVDYLTKPVDAAELHARVTIHIHRQ